MALYRFGSGLLFARPISGVGASYTFGTLQDVSVDMSNDIKTMYGSYDTPDIAALGKLKVDLKAKFGVIDSNMFNALYYAATPSSGMKMFVNNEAQTIAAGGTVTATNPTGFQDISVMYAASGVPFLNIGSGTPTEGQYTVSNQGVYTFAAADDSAPVLLNYTYTTSTATSGTTFQRRARLMGGTQFFSLFLYNSFNGVQCNMEFYRVLASKLSQATKNDDFTVPEMDFTVFNSPSNQVYTIYDQSVIL